MEDDAHLRSVLADAFRVCAEYLTTSRSREVGASPTSPLAAGDISLSHRTPSADLPRLLESYLQATPRTNHVGFANQLSGGVTVAGIVGELAAAVASTTMATAEAAPAATRVEIELVRKVLALAELPPMPRSDGIVTSGGSQSNMVALMCARYWKAPNVKENGLSGMPRLVAFVSSQAHYSFAGAANQTGIGTSSLRCIPCDKDGRMIPSELELAISHCLNSGEMPFFVAATAGTTVLGAFDPIREISAIAKKYSLWLHVDGAWGGPLLLCQKYKSKLDGVCDADSFTIDMHKLMSVPLTCSVFVTRHADILTEACSAGNRSYLFHALLDEEGCPPPDLGVKSLACGRRPDCLKAWMTWKYLGDEGYEREICRLMALAQTMAKLVKESDTLELVANPGFLNVCFRYAPKDGLDRDLNALTLEIRSRLVARGWWLVNFAWVGKDVVFRFILTNFRLSEEDIRSLLLEIEEIGKVVDMEAQSQPLAYRSDHLGRVSPSII